MKWAGGKRQLLPELRRFYPEHFGAYVEPFFGSGAVFFDLHRSGALAGHPITLIDANADLVACYETVRDFASEVGDALEALAEGHRGAGRDHYYEVRDRRFNPEREARRDENGRVRYTPALAAMLIYLNRTGFNGLFRVNASGAFNVPAGRYERPRIVDRDRLQDVAAALAAPVTLLWGSYERALDVAARGDFLYFDPPYVPLSRTANFTSYTNPRFTDDDQRRLQAMAIALAKRQCQILMSNSTADLIAELYDDNAAARAAGLRALRIPARRAINSNASRRGTVDEYLITNIDGARP